MDFFHGKVCVVTGAGSGIGRALSEGLARRGAVVRAWDINEVALQSFVAEARKFNWEVFPDVVDITKPEMVKTARDQVVAKHTRIDYWINNAGIAVIKGFEETSPADFDRVMAVNFGGLVHGTRLALEHMEGRGSGTVVNVASVAGFIAAPYLASYSAAKHAVVGFTAAIHEELRMKDSPIKVVLVAPGFVDTAIIAKGTKDGFPEWLNWILSTPSNVTEEVLTGLRRGRSRIFPTWNGRLMMRMYRLFPRITARSSRLLLVRRFKDLLLNRYTVD